MRVMRVTLLMLPLALLLSTAAFGAPSTDLTPLSMEQLEQEIFGAPKSMSSFPAGATEVYPGVCAYTCEPCTTMEDCPPLGGRRQACVWACY